MEGFRHISEKLSRSAQEALVKELRFLITIAPFFTPHMPQSGRPMSVRMTSLGRFGWYASRSGYEYLELHPITGLPFPDIPDSLLNLWRDIAPGEADPDSCLVNYYGPSAKMGLHADLDEEDRSAPVVSISLGDTAMFRLGGVKRSDPTRSFKLASGDVMVLEGPMRNAHHGVDRIISGSSTLLDRGGRLNLTLRRVKSVR